MVREKSREYHNHKPQPFPDSKRKRKQTKPNKRKSNKRTKTYKRISRNFEKSRWPASQGQTNIALDPSRYMRILFWIHQGMRQVSCFYHKLHNSFTYPPCLKPFWYKSEPEVMKLLSCWTQLNMIVFQLINMKGQQNMFKQKTPTLWKPDLNNWRNRRIFKAIHSYIF